MVSGVTGRRRPSHVAGKFSKLAGQLSETVAVGLCSNSRDYILDRLAISCFVSSRGGLLSATFTRTGRSTDSGGLAMNSTTTLVGPLIITR
jgi:hypothetical protein